MKRSGLIALLVIAIQLSGSTLLTQRRGGGGNYRSSAQTNVNRSLNVNRNVNVNNHVNLNRNVNVNVNNNYHGGGVLRRRLL
jgi:hypothetical protein